MKIITLGTIPEERPIHCECKHCHTVVEITLNEVNVVHDQREGSYFTWACPVCFTENYKTVV